MQVHLYISMVSCQKGPTCHAYAWQIGPFLQNTLDFCKVIHHKKVLNLRSKSTGISFLSISRDTSIKWLPPVMVMNVQFSAERAPKVIFAIEYTVTPVSLYYSLFSIESSAVIMWSNIVRYCMNDCRNSGRISIRYWIHKRCPIPHSKEPAMGCLLWILFEKIDCIIVALHCIRHSRILKCCVQYGSDWCRIEVTLWINNKQNISQKTLHIPPSEIWGIFHGFKQSGPRFNIKMSYGYRKSIVEIRQS